MHHEYRWAMAEADADPEVRAVVVTGAGRGFCAGADARALDGHVAKGAYDSGVVDDELPRPGYGVRPEFDHAFAFHFGLTVPVIAAVNGPAAGRRARAGLLRRHPLRRRRGQAHDVRPPARPARRVRPVVDPAPPRRCRPRRRPAPVEPDRAGRGGRRDGSGQPGAATRRAPPGDLRLRPDLCRRGLPQLRPGGQAPALRRPPRRRRHRRRPQSERCWKRWSRPPTSPKASPPSRRSASPGSESPTEGRSSAHAPWPRASRWHRRRQ